MDRVWQDFKGAEGGRVDPNIQQSDLKRRKTL